MAITTKTRDDEIREVQEQYPDLYKISSAVGLIVIGIWVGTLLFTDGYVTNIYTELLSVGATVAVIDQLNRRREMQEQKLDLFRRVRSLSNGVAVEALDQIKHAGWWDEMLKHCCDDKGDLNLYGVHWAGGVDLSNCNFNHANLRLADLQQAALADANLEEAILRDAKLQEAYMGRSNLRKANLKNANLREANLEICQLQDADFTAADLQSANLYSAKLQKAHLENALLQKANLRYAEMQQVWLVSANLQTASLMSANLQQANLHKADFRGANLSNANLRGARYIEQAKFDERTILPDAQFFEMFWTPDIDMKRYTDPTHPDFWEPI